VGELLFYILFSGACISGRLKTIPQQTRNGNILVTLPECFQKHQWFCRELTAKHERAAVVFLPLFFLLRSEQRSKRIWSFKIVKEKFRKAQMPFQNLAICKP